MSDKSTNDMVRFESPQELACHLYDRAVEPRDTGKTRLRMALLSAVFASRKWRELKTDTEQ